MNDISPELYEALTKYIEKAIARDSRISAIAKRIAAGTATHADTHQYSVRLGEITSEAFQAVLTPEALPDGTLYYNIAENTVGKAMYDNHGRVNEIASQIQNNLNREAGLGLNSVEATVNTGRIEGLVDNMTADQMYETAQDWMKEPVVNTTQSFADDFIQENANAHYQAGLTPTITRTASPGCCEWCAKLVGTYIYSPFMNEDVFHRHEYCRCVTTYDPKDETKGIQDVWTKQWEKDPSVIEARRNYGL